MSSQLITIDSFSTSNSAAAADLHNNNKIYVYALPRFCGVLSYLISRSPLYYIVITTVGAEERGFAKYAYPPIKYDRRRVRACLQNII